MAVWCRQQADGEPDQEYAIEPHYEGQPDAELLALKERGARDKGWKVKRSGGVVTATKIRWGGVLCTRTFWAD